MLSFIVPAIAGITFGKWSGTTTGFAGGLLSYLFIKPDGFAAAYIVAYTVVGFLSGWLADKYNGVTGSASLIVGHVVLHAMLFLLAIRPLSTLHESLFYIMLGTEMIIGLISVNIITIINAEIFTFEKEGFIRW